MKILWIYCSCLVFLILTSCNNGSEEKLDTVSSGTINISVDESFKPIIATEIKAYEAAYPKAHIIPHYKSESECFKDLLNDSAMLIIVTRELNDKEMDYFKNQLRIDPRYMKIAYDAVTLIVNPADKDTTLTMDQVRAIMDGSYKQRNYQLVFDQQNSSTVRFAIDSINHGKPLPANTMAANGSEEVVDYVANHKDALGVIGVNWVSDPNDSTALSFLDKIRVVGIKSDSSLYYNKPYQAYIAMKSYPLTRSVYFITRQVRTGLGTGFATFLAGEKGQLIIGNYRLFPAKMNYQIRKVDIK